MQSIFKRRAKNITHVVSALVMIYIVISASETDVMLSPLLQNRMMNLRLSGKRKREDSFMSQLFPIASNAVAVGGEDVIEERSLLDETLEVGRIFFIPERRGNTFSL